MNCVWEFYLRNGKVYIPTLGRTENGPHIGIEPVRVVESTDAGGLRRAVEEALLAGNPLIPTPEQGNFPKPVLLPHAKVKSWKTFEQSAQLWQVTKSDRGIEIWICRRAAPRGFCPGPASAYVFPKDEPFSAIADRVAKLIETASAADGDGHGREDGDAVGVGEGDGAAGERAREEKVRLGCGT
jgi:hypothetical protein